jgi:predicted dehydrogenase
MIDQAYADASKSGRDPILMVGFNRRFAPQIVKMKSLLVGANGPKAFIVTVNAGAIPTDHWTQDRETGGGRIVGEGCHFIDLLRFLAGSHITLCTSSTMNSTSSDTVTMQLEFADGSIGSVHYFANGTKSFPKERVEVFAAGRVLQLNNFRKLRGFGWPGFSKLNLWNQDKGQTACAKAFLDAIVHGMPSPIPIAEVLEIAKTSIEAAEFQKTQS